MLDLYGIVLVEPSFKTREPRYKNNSLSKRLWCSSMLWKHGKEFTFYKEVCVSTAWFIMLPWGIGDPGGVLAKAPLRSHQGGLGMSLPVGETSGPCVFRHAIYLEEKVLKCFFQMTKLKAQSKLSHTTAVYTDTHCTCGSFIQASPRLNTLSHIIRIILIVVIIIIYVTVIII